MEISPTKTNLIEFKGQLEFSKDGKNLLEEKREVLILRLLEVISDIKQKRERLDKILMESYSLLNDIVLKTGEYNIMAIISGITEFRRVEIIEKSIMGVAIPIVRYRKEYNLKPLNFTDTDSDFDELITNINEIMALIIYIAQIESAAWRLANEIRKTQKRVNALDSIFIPEFNSIIKFIQESLEEKERETFFQMKKIKARKEKEDNNIEGNNG